jgi:hypothetical protein
MKYIFGKVDRPVHVDGIIKEKEDYPKAALT